MNILRDLGRAAKDGALRGMRQAPILFFTPMIAIWRLFNSTAEQLLGESEQKHRAKAKARLSH